MLFSRVDFKDNFERLWTIKNIFEGLLSYNRDFSYKYYLRTIRRMIPKFYQMNFQKKFRFRKKN